MTKDNFIKQLEKDIKNPGFGKYCFVGSESMSDDELEFLNHSNCIEGEYSKEALEDAAKAWNFFKNWDLFTCSAILECHKVLMRRLRPDIAGKLRTCDVWVGRTKKIFVSQKLLEEEIQSLCREIDFTEVCRDLEEWTKKLHIQFENVHPFEDGNGRVGRIIYNAHRLRLGLPIHVIHEGREQMEYYKWFSEVKT